MVLVLLLGSGEIEFEEFCAMMANRINQPIDSPEELIEAFEVRSLEFFLGTLPHTGHSCSKILLMLFLLSG